MVRMIQVIIKKELRSHFTSPALFVICAAFLSLAGLFFYLNTSYYSALSMASAAKPAILQMINSNFIIISSSFSYMAILILFLLPVLTMKTIADERKNKTLELIMTSPLSTFDIVLGKFLAVLVVFTVILILSFCYPVILSFYTHLDYGIVFSGYLGLFLLGMFYLSIGLLTSCLSENQLISASLAVIILICLWSLPTLAQSVGGSLSDFVQHISLTNHFNSFNKGLIEFKSIIFFLSITIFVLVVAERMMESERWR